MGNGGGLSDEQSIFGRPHSRQMSSHFDFILSYNENSYSIFPNILFHSLLPRFRESMQLCGSSQLGSIMDSHLATLVELEPLFVITSVSMSQEVWCNVDGGLSAL